MTNAQFALAVLTVVSLAVVWYAYVGYPALIWLLARWCGRAASRPEVSDADLPRLSLVIAAYNEQKHIKERVRNALDLDYPADRFEVVVASDGSTDATEDIVAAFDDPRVRLIAYPERRGKAAVLNDTIGRLTGDVVMFSDANTTTNRDAARQLAAWFADPSIGVVCGRLVLTDPRAGRNVDSLYWKYETFMKKCESKLGALLGSNGGIYAMRKSVYSPIPNDTVVDDFVIPLLARAKSGCRLVYDRDAVACEETPATITSEVHRRARIGAGGFQSIGILRGLLNPKHGWVFFSFVSHKVARWVSPFLLIAGLVGSAFLVNYPLFAALFVAQVAFYLLSLVAGWLPAKPRFLRFFRLPAMFTMMNAALFVGFLRWLFGVQKVAWRTRVEIGALPPSFPRLMPREEAAPVGTRFEGEK